MKINTQAEDQTPINQKIVEEEIEKMGLNVVGLASIRELVRLVDHIEEATGEKFIRMEMGIPSLSPPQIAMDAEIDALKKGVASKYPPFDGIPELKQEISCFVENFFGVKSEAQSCFPTVGSMQGCYLATMLTCRRIKGKNKILFIDPGFPPNKLQASIIGVPYEGFDVYDYRGDKLREKLESFLEQGDIASIMYSNPNNPSWICFTDHELAIIGELATKYDCIIIEDLAYFGMDFRKDYSIPHEAPFIPSIANYTDNYILLISCSKSFSLAGQRLSMTVVSDTLFSSKHENLVQYFRTDNFGHAYVFGALSSITTGVSHSSQLGLLALLRAINSGKYNFLSDVKTYSNRAKIMKQLFTSNGFTIVYDMDGEQKIADGFYFTIAYPSFSGPDLVKELLYYGISAISLSTMGSDRPEGLRACVSLTTEEKFPVLEQRLKAFHKNHPL